VGIVGGRPDNGDMKFDPAIRAYYDRGEEASRLFGGMEAGPLELERTRELILRFIPDGPLDVLDVGGGPGVYASWLADLGHRVHVIDPIPLHVEQAAVAHQGVSAEVGDARNLTQQDGSADVVLLLGPLYHLTERNERLTAVAEAMRVLRPDGLLFAAAISRFAALLDLLVNWNKIHEPGVFELVEESVRTGIFAGPGQGGLFTTSYFHLPSELAEEVSEAGFRDVEIFQIEGPGFLVADFSDRWNDPVRKEALLRAARLVELEPEMRGASSHLLAVARRAR
jgi:SAM-dependent methyltransferase